MTWEAKWKPACLITSSPSYGGRWLFLFQALVISKSFFCRCVKLFLNSNKDRYALSLKIAQSSLQHLWIVTPSRKSALHERITKPFAKQAFRTRPFGCFCLCSAIEQNPFWSWIQTLLFLHVHDLLAKLLMLETINVVKPRSYIIYKFVTTKSF